jgi:hypothetical protein
MISRVKKLLRDLETRTERRALWLVYREQFDPVGFVRIEVYPTTGAYQGRMVNLSGGLTPGAAGSICKWFEALA